MSRLLVCFLVLSLPSFLSKPIDPEHEATQLYNSLPEEEREYFLKYHIARKAEGDGFGAHPGREETRPARLSDLVGVPDELHRKYTAMDCSPEVSDALYRWVQTQNGLSDEEMVLLAVRGTVCRPSAGSCASLNNPGSNCCM